MPITIEALSKEAFEAWVKDAQQKFARVDDGQPTGVAALPAATTAAGTPAAAASGTN
jgi:heme/copper-type cytochrome/quinol oxidase subunit 2